MLLLRTTPFVQLLLPIDTSWPLSPILYCSGHFSALPKLYTLYTPHSFCVPHPFHILHRLPLSISSNGSPFVQLLLHIDTSWLYPLSFIAQHTFQRSPSFIPCSTSLSHPPSAATCDPRYLIQSTSSNRSPFIITCIRLHYQTASTS